jgi:hypothetical protein
MTFFFKIVLDDEPAIDVHGSASLIRAELLNLSARVWIIEGVLALIEAALTTGNSTTMRIDASGTQVLFTNNYNDYVRYSVEATN